MSHSIHSIAKEIVEREGGFVNDPDDPGGATKFGVTIHTMRRLKIDLNGDGDVDVRDVKLLSVERAVSIFLRHYFHKPRIAELPDCLHATVFDMQVNAGGNAIKILQRLCNRILPKGDILTIDGQIGPMTLRKVKQCHQEIGDSIVDAYSVERRNYYFRIADRRPASRKYARTRAGGKGGWIKRAEEFMAPKYRLTDAQFTARVSKW